MNNSIYIEDDFHKYDIEKYFNQIKGNDLLSDEDKKSAYEILQELNTTCKVRSVSKVYSPSKFRIDNGELLIGEMKIKAKLFEEEYFHGIISLLVFIITICDTIDSDLNDRAQEQGLSLLDQYYEVMWKYAALQVHRDNIVEEYKKNFSKSLFTPILGPGYYGIDLIENSKLYELLNGKDLGITVNDKNQFIPENTICGFMIGMESMSKECREIFDNPCLYCKAVKKACGFCYNNKLV